jgi:hypothetical protein
MGRTLGMILIGVGLIFLLLIGAVMYVPSFGGEGRSFGAATLGFALFAGVVALPLIGAGVFLYMRGHSEAEQMAAVQKQRKLLGIVKARGQVDIDDVALEVSATRDEVRSMLYLLVDKGLYSGYINWDKGALYSEQASALRELHTCRNCSGQLDLAGKGVIRCPYCGTEYFL